MQIKYINDIIDVEKFNERDLEPDDINRLEDAVSQLEDMRNNYGYTSRSN